MIQSQEVISSAKSKEKRKRKIAYSWAQQCEVSALIAAVEKRPALWDGGCMEYKLGNIKHDCWQQVSDELGIPGVDAYEARNKWNAVRSLFKANLGKIRMKKSGQSSSEKVNVTWAHFSEMMFIESAEVAQSSESTSTMALVCIFMFIILYALPHSLYIFYHFRMVLIPMSHF